MSPRAYESIRDRLIQQGYSTPRAQEKAARIYNAKHPDTPVGRRGPCGEKSEKGKG